MKELSLEQLITKARVCLSVGNYESPNAVHKWRRGNLLRQQIKPFACILGETKTSEKEKSFELEHKLSEIVLLDNRLTAL